MDEFYKELALQLADCKVKNDKNARFTKRILEAKRCIKEGEPINESDIHLIDDILEDALIMNAIISDNFNSFEKFMKMYT